MEAGAPLRRVGGPPRRCPATRKLNVSPPGPGLPDAVADILFLPFPTHDSAGVGLRLVIAKAIIDAHGGIVACENNNGGTRYTITL